MQPNNVDPRYSRRSRRDPEETQERYIRNRRKDTRGQRVREADREQQMIQAVNVYTGV